MRKPPKKGGVRKEEEKKCVNGKGDFNPGTNQNRKLEIKSKNYAERERKDSDTRRP